jgi:hypothetical protein
MGYQVRRLITKFARESDRRAQEIDITNVPFEVISDIVMPAPTDPLLYDSYRLNTDQILRFKEFISEEIDPARFDYFLEAEGG